ncbi:MAG: DNA/RNA helicase domain-containing protein, partial [Pyrinomonadaceae bacterium]
SQGSNSNRSGLVASSGAARLKPYGIFVKSKIKAADWFLKGKDDVRSSYYLEDVATEFDIQGLELDWIGVCWDGDFFFNGETWESQNFSGSSWKNVNEMDQRYLKNTYRVLLTRARQGMVIFVPPGDQIDATRPSQFYDGTFEYLSGLGIEVLEQDEFLIDRE